MSRRMSDDPGREMVERGGQHPAVRAELHVSDVRDATGLPAELDRGRFVGVGVEEPDRLRVGRDGAQRQRPSIGGQRHLGDREDRVTRCARNVGVEVSRRRVSAS